MAAPAKFQKRPVTIEAMQWDGTQESRNHILAWIGSHGGHARYASAQPETRLRGKVIREAVPALIAIDTLEGTMHAIECDWIIRGVQGEFYPCKPEIFAATYEAAE